MIKQVIFLGAPGVGKGTIADLISKKTGMKHISTGDIFRNEIKNKTSLGLKVEEILAAGKYVSDDITNEIVKKALQDPAVIKTGFILDGYPRTINQANFLKTEGIKIHKTVLLNAPQDELVKRLLARGRVDDSEETIKERIKIYEKETKQLIDYYKDEELLQEFDASGHINDNLEIVCKGLGY